MLNKMKKWIGDLIADERGAVSSKRVLGLMCGITVCGAIWVSANPSEHLVDAVTMLAFGCLGLTTLDKFTTLKNDKPEETP
jgi:hypothetical protein